MDTDLILTRIQGEEQHHQWPSHPQLLDCTDSTVAVPQIQIDKQSPELERNAFCKIHFNLCKNNWFAYLCWSLPFRILLCTKRSGWDQECSKQFLPCRHHLHFWRQFIYTYLTFKLEIIVRVQHTYKSTIILEFRWFRSWPSCSSRRQFCKVQSCHPSLSWPGRERRFVQSPNRCFPHQQ